MTKQVTPAELEVMKVLWSVGESSAREVHEGLVESRGWAYTTTRTLIERLVTKKWLSKRRLHGINVYVAAVSRVQGIAGLLRDFAHRILEVDRVPVAPLFAESEALTAQEIAELERLLEEDATR